LMAHSVVCNAARCPLMGEHGKWPDHGQNDANDPTETLGLVGEQPDML
jgi:hypothetical protein